MTVCVCGWLHLPLCAWHPAHASASFGAACCRCRRQVQQVHAAAAASC